MGILISHSVFTDTFLAGWGGNASYYFPSHMGIVDTKIGVAVVALGGDRNPDSALRIVWYHPGGAGKRWFIIDEG